MKSAMTKTTMPPHAAPVLTVRSAGSHIVGFLPLPFSQTTPGPTQPCCVQCQCWVAHWLCGVHGTVGSVPQRGTGPREVPSHSSQPTAHPLEK